MGDLCWVISRTTLRVNNPCRDPSPVDMYESTVRLSDTAMFVNKNSILWKFNAKMYRLKLWLTIFSVGIFIDRGLSQCRWIFCGSNKWFQFLSNIKIHNYFLPVSAQTPPTTAFTLPPQCHLAADRGTCFPQIRPDLQLPADIHRWYYEPRLALCTVFLLVTDINIRWKIFLNSLF